MGDQRHIDMFHRPAYDTEIDSDRLGDLKKPFKHSNWGEKLPFQRQKRFFTLKPSILEAKKSKITIWPIIGILICFLGRNVTQKLILHGWRIIKTHLSAQIVLESLAKFLLEFGTRKKKSVFFQFQFLQGLYSPGLR